MRIGLDVMGGDYAPQAVLEGAFDALGHLSSDEVIVLVGPEKTIFENLGKEGIDKGRFDIINAPEVIGMGEHPAKSYSQKQNSSIAIGYKNLKSNNINGFCSAGNTGAMLVGASYTVNVIPGVFRPALATFLPGIENNYSVLLDVGLNLDSKPDVLLQYAKLGSLYAKYVLGKEHPSVALVNVGEEESKGPVAVKAAYELLKENLGINFLGNIEGNSLFTGDMPDVIVCDGFVGNIIIKQAEAFYSIYRKRKMKDDFFDRLNFENIGGTPIVGINGNVVIGHGISRRKAIMNMILQTRDVIKADLANKIKEEI